MGLISDLGEMKMPNPPFLPLQPAWIKGSGESGREGGPKSGPLRRQKQVPSIAPVCREGGPKSGPLRLLFIGRTRLNRQEGGPKSGPLRLIF